MNTMIKSGICLACILAGIALQFFMPGDFSFWAGTALIFIPVLALSPETPKQTSIDMNNLKTRWCDIAPEDVQSTFLKLNNKKKNTNYGSGIEKYYYKGCLNAFVFFIVIMLGIMMWGDDDPVSGCIIIDILAVPWALLHLKYGSDLTSVFDSPINAGIGSIEKKISNIQYINQLITETGFIKPTLQLEVSHSNINLITDIRLGLNTDERIEGVLCSMVSVSQNNVEDVLYPYSYFVVVFKGEEIYNTYYSQVRELASMHFEPELNINDGNTVLVFTKKSGHPEYTTKNEDCIELVDVICQCFNWMNARRSSIKKLTK